MSPGGWLLIPTTRQAGATSSAFEIYDVEELAADMDGGNGAGFPDANDGGGGTAGNGGSGGASASGFSDGSACQNS